MMTFSQGSTAKIKSKQFSEFGSRTIGQIPERCERKKSKWLTVEVHQEDRKDDFVDRDRRRKRTYLIISCYSIIAG